MRIDLLLNKLCLVKSRNIAKNASDKKLIKINGKIAKASSEVNENDVIDYSIYGYNTTIRVIKIPTGNVAKKNATDYYELIKREKVTPDY